MLGHVDISDESWLESDSIYKPDDFVSHLATSERTLTAMSSDSEVGPGMAKSMEPMKPKRWSVIDFSVTFCVHFVLTKTGRWRFKPVSAVTQKIFTLQMMH